MSLIGVLKGESEESKIEVHAHNGEEDPILELRYMSWGSGIGWFCQKSIRIDQGQEAQLFRILEQRRQWIARRNKSISNVLPFDLKTLLKTG